MNVPVSAPKCCCLCGAPPNVIGSFVPKHQDRVQERKVRVIMYALCTECFRQPNAQSRVEEKVSRADTQECLG